MTMITRMMAIGAGGEDPHPTLLLSACPRKFESKVTVPSESLGPSVPCAHLCTSGSQPRASPLWTPAPWDSLCLGGDLGGPPGKQEHGPEPSGPYWAP